MMGAHTTRSDTVGRHMFQEERRLSRHGCCHSMLHTSTSCTPSVLVAEVVSWSAARPESLESHGRKSATSLPTASLTQAPVLHPKDHACMASLSL